MRFPRRLMVLRFSAVLYLFACQRILRPSGLQISQSFWGKADDLSQSGGSDRDRDQAS